METKKAKMGKEKVLHVPVSVPQTMSESEPGISRGATEHKTQQVQDHQIAERTELAMGNDPQSRSAMQIPE